jgi:hypothetical protein
MDIGPDGDPCGQGGPMCKYRRITAVTLAAIALLALPGCSKVSQLRQSTATADISQWTAQTMTQAFSAINAKIGANPADYENVTINELFVRVEAINPNKRENVDRYTFQGGNVEVAPVDVSRNQPGAIETAAFKSDIVKPEVLAQVMNAAPKDSGIAEKPVIRTVLVKKKKANDSAPVTWVMVKGPRGEKSLFYDITGAFQSAT